MWTEVDTRESKEPELRSSLIKFLSLLIRGAEEKQVFVFVLFEGRIRGCDCFH